MTAPTALTLAADLRAQADTERMRTRLHVLLGRGEK